MQVVGGAGISYRALGGTPTQLETLERPAASFLGYISGSYALTDRFTLSAGLGYSEYATALRYQFKKSAQDSARAVAVAFRDVYRFVTVPLQAQYRLGGNHRWQYGVLGGGTVALLRGARTTEGSACACTQKQWQPGTGATIPFRTTSVLLNAGAFVHYQFAPGQWLMLRPQGQMFLNSLTTPASGRAPRRPWSLGVQVGYSFDLAPRRP